MQYGSRRHMNNMMEMLNRSGRIVVGDDARKVLFIDSDYGERVDKHEIFTVGCKYTIVVEDSDEVTDMYDDEMDAIKVVLRHNGENATCFWIK